MNFYFVHQLKSMLFYFLFLQNLQFFLRDHLYNVCGLRIGVLDEVALRIGSWTHHFQFDVFLKSYFPINCFDRLNNVVVSFGSDTFLFISHFSICYFLFIMYNNIIIELESSEKKVFNQKILLTFKFQYWCQGKRGFHFLRFN